MRKIRGYFVVNKSTGEAIDIHLEPEKRRNAGGKWMRIYLDFTKRLALDKTIHGQTRQVKDYLLSKVDYSNHVPGPSVISKEMGIPQPSVSRAYKELRRAEVLIIKDNDYYLSPLYCWQGSQTQYEEARRKLLDIPLLGQGERHENS